MAKAKSKRPAKAQKQPYLKGSIKAQGSTTSSNAKIPKSRSHHHLQPHVTLPFSPAHSILLVGEGDFSFAASLLMHHHCSHLTATSLDPLPTVLSKYHSAALHIAALNSASQTVLHAIDATRLSAAPGQPSQSKTLRQNAPYDRIIFNFPHTGGLTKDVNRQVRANQELLVNFFRSALGILSEGGRIVVSLFEAEAYGDWNIKDLARSVDLRCIRSERFGWEGFPGYRHVRTLGVVEGGWKGEDRDARWYAFGRKEEGDDLEGLTGTGIKGQRNSSNEDDDDDKR